MSAKVIPPKTPLSKSLSHYQLSGEDIDVSEKGVTSGKKGFQGEKTSPGAPAAGADRINSSYEYVYTYCLCPQCRGDNLIVTEVDAKLKTHKCAACGEVLPAGAYRVWLQANYPV